MEEISINRKAIKKLTYTSFLKSPAKDKWQRIGPDKRSGIAVPLFSIYSKSSIGIGEIPDLKIVIDWCKNTGFSIIQLLPVYDTGYGFSPYSAVSSFALDLMYLRLQDLKEVDLAAFSKEIEALKRKFSINKKLVNYEIKKAKSELLLKIFKTNKNKENKSLEKFQSENKYWIEDYALFKVLSDRYNSSNWENWNRQERSYDKKHLGTIYREYSNEINFQIWLQWQLSEQLKEVKKYASENGVLLMGDIPFLVSRNSSDVWSHQNYFKLSLTSGAPPDMYFAYGQKWGMPPYNWKNIGKDKYVYIKERLKSAENYFDMFRIDHFVGLFRIWTVPKTPDVSKPEKMTIEGKFDPEDENKWEQHGKRIIKAMLKFSTMLPCAEDLGTVPYCSYKTLKEYSIPGIEFQRYMKKMHNFINPSNYRINSASVVSTHDSSFFINWFDYEAGSIDQKLFVLICHKDDLDRKEIRKITKILFDKHLSKHGRLFWKSKITKKFIETLFRKTDHLRTKMNELYLDSFKEKEKFLKLLSIQKKRSLSKTELCNKNLKIVCNSSSIFNIQLVQEFLCLDLFLMNKINKWNHQINRPGTINNKNWSMKLPISLEKLLDLKINAKILELNKKSGRIPQ